MYSKNKKLLKWLEEDCTQLWFNARIKNWILCITKGLLWTTHIINLENTEREGYTDDNCVRCVWHCWWTENKSTLEKRAEHAVDKRETGWHESMHFSCWNYVRDRTTTTTLFLRASSLLFNRERPSCILNVHSTQHTKSVWLDEYWWQFP